MGGRPCRRRRARSADAGAVAPPAAKTPDMTLPDPKVKARAEDAGEAAPPDAKIDDADARRRSRSAGSAVAETGARGVGFGLTTGGGGTGGYLDVGNFCCPEYLTTMLQLIQRNWSATAGGGRADDREVHDPAGRPASPRSRSRSRAATSRSI